MNKGISIYAKFGTKERIVVFLHPSQNNTPKLLADKYGGEWVKVNELCLGDTLKFDSDDIYQGFDNRDSDNYCQGSLDINTFQSQSK